MADSYLCRDCSKIVTATKNDRYRTHHRGDGERCEASSVEIPPDLLEQGPVDPKDAPAVPVKGQDFETCHQCGRNVKLTRLGYFEPHAPTLYGGERCPASGVRAFHAGRTVDVPLPGDELPEKGVYRAQVPEVSDQDAAKAVEIRLPKELTAAPTAPTPGAPEAVAGTTSGATPTTPESPESTLPVDMPFTEMSSPESPTTSTPSEGSTEGSDSSSSEPEPPPFSLGVTLSDQFLQPFSPFLQPVSVEAAETESGVSGASESPNASGIVPASKFLQPPEYAGPVKAEPMGELAKELATKIKETFYAYSNRKSSDNRSAQTTLGPSEIGTPCDRRLAMALMNVPPVNAGGDGWAAFVGTCTHVGMAEVYTFADAGTGRYAVELPVFLGVPTVPRGTTDLLDRRDATVVDWKVMGAYSLKKFKEKGPSETYLTQGQVYGLGAERAGEKVKNVAIVGLPRAGSSLDEMHVWTTKYDRKFAQAALDRVESIAKGVEFQRNAGLPLMEIAERMESGDDCRYCPFHLPKDKGFTRGCPGK